MPRSDLWTRDQLLLALRLYMRLPFGKLHQSNREIIQLAGQIGRNSNAMAMKACNFANLDPALQARGIAGAELLTASHIIPWSDSVERRADPRNGLCLNALLDRAFDRGMFTFDDELRVVVSKRLIDGTANARLKCSLDEIEGVALRSPNRFPPDLEAIRFHRANVFAA
jgi:predicted restriction endonuclease